VSELALSRAELVVRTVAQTAVDNATYLSELDAAAGDGDFGYSLASGFEIVLANWETLEYEDIGGLLKRTAVILTKQIGGSSGTIWGTAFLRAALSLAGVGDPDTAQVIGAMRAAIGGVKQRGDCELGDKTVLEALVPAVDALEESLVGGSDLAAALDRAAASARAGAIATKGMLARRGRATCAGERSRDSVDAGAVGVAIIFEAVSRAYQEAVSRASQRASVHLA
jgi:dihydroxyacetone kinase phosphoprotein-dependent L subunit